MERFYGYVSSAEATLSRTLNLLVKFFARITDANIVISDVIIGANHRTKSDILANDCIKSLSLPIAYDFSANYSLFTVKKSRDDGFGFILESNLRLLGDATAAVHVLNFAADESLILLYGVAVPECPPPSFIALLSFMA